MIDLNALSKEDLVKRLQKIRKLAQAAMDLEEVSDVKYVMRDVDEILVLAGGKRTDAW